MVTPPQTKQPNIKQTSQNNRSHNQQPTNQPTTTTSRSNNNKNAPLKTTTNMEAPSACPCCELEPAPLRNLRSQLAHGQATVEQWMRLGQNTPWHQDLESIFYSKDRTPGHQGHSQSLLPTACFFEVSFMAGRPPGRVSDDCVRNAHILAPSVLTP